MKACTKCGVQKTRRGYYHRSVTRDGLSSWCKQCLGKWERKRRRIPEFREKRNLRRRLFWKNNIELCRKRARREYWRHRKRHVEESKRNYRSHRAKYLKQMREYYRLNSNKIKNRVARWKIKQWKNNRKLVLRKRRMANLKSHGLTLKQFYDILKKQKRRCAICKARRPGGNGTWHVDHNHKTGKARGLLCSRCNLALGLFGDDIKILRRAIYYLSSTSRRYDTRGTT